MPVQNRIQVRRGTAAAGSNQWTDQVLYSGEIGYETDTGRFKIGNGATIWSTLPYASVLQADIDNDATIVRTSGNQTIGGQKTLTSTLVISSEVSGIQLLGTLGSAIQFDSGGDFVIDRTGNTFLIQNNTSGLLTLEGATIQLSGATQMLAANSASAATFFPVFTSNPNTAVQTISSRTAAQVKSDIGLSNVENVGLSTITFTAGNGLTGGGTLASNRTFDVGAGSGISVTTNAVSVDSTVVRTSGAQTIEGEKTFSDLATFNGGIYTDNILAPTGDLTISSLDTVGITTEALTIDISGGSAGSISFIYNHSTDTQNVQFNNNATTVLNVSDDVAMLAAASASAATQFAVFTTSPASTAQPIVTRTAAQVKSDIGLSNVENVGLSTITFSAGDGLTGGGTLAANRSFAVDSTVVRTSGLQYISAPKIFMDSTNTYDILAVENSGVSLKAPNTTDTTYYFLGLDGGASPPSSTDADRTVISRSASQVKSDLSLNNVTNHAQVKKIATTTIGNLPTWSVTTGDELGTGYAVETTLTGSSTAIPRADAVKIYVDSMVGASDAMVFKGTIGTGGTVTVLPTVYGRGWTYRVITAGTYAGQVCEVGDLIIAVNDSMVGSGSGSGAYDENWTVAQNNLDGAVIGPASATTNAFVLFDGSSGKLIKNSGFTAVPVDRGGTGATTLTGILLGNGTSAITSLTSSTACQVLVRNSANTGYEFTSTLCGLVIDGGTP